ncbi:MAG: hypothetical protein OXJ37_14635 [Bryobacterales bacterium]|nr:hypothetical protein [Bryobacterales bacterium]MDE0263636.1 hypothetical protein [Bryobacterales bacterium]MDE0623116.1 hypothetical protein [Bryobacterales bacterium]
MDDGVRLNTSLFMPDGTAAPNGWAAIVLMHGLGGSRAAASASRRARVRHIAKGASWKDVRGHNQFVLS